MADTHAREADSERYADLIRRAGVENDPVAMEQLLEDVQALAYRFSLHVCGHTEDAEDAMQDALMQTYRHARRIRQPRGFRTWLYRTVKNACLMSRRTRVDQPAHLESLDTERPPEVADADPDPEAQTAAAEERRRFRAAFRRLPDSYRLVAFLRDVEGLSTREAAAVAGISEANVKQRLHRARAMLKESLAAEEPLPPAVARAIRTRARSLARS
jgi:RNA polymerase sigma-70 factor (ECF subfamily)